MTRAFPSKGTRVSSRPLWRAVPMGSACKRAVFLDRDGVLLKEVIDADSPPRAARSMAEYALYPGSQEAVSALKELGLQVVVVTNQADVARGRANRSAVEEIHRRLKQELNLSALYACFHDTPDGCSCRKPKPGLIQQAAQELGLSLARSFLVGDHRRDIEAGRQVGCTTLLLRQPLSEESPADVEVNSLGEAADWIKRQIQAQRYALLKRRLWLLDLGVSFGGLAAFIALGGNLLLADWVATWASGWILQTLAVVLLLGFAFTLLTFPLDYLRSFRLEHRFGLSTQTFPQWFREYLKRLLVGGILGLIVAEAAVALIWNFPSNWWVWATGAWCLWSLFLTWVAPQWLLPIFYRQEPLQDSSLRHRLEQLCAKSGAKVRGIYQVNLSKTTRKANACLCGLGSTRRVLLSDTLVSSYPVEGVEVILAHELGHHRLRHLWILTVVSTLLAGVSFFLIDWAMTLSWVSWNAEETALLRSLPLLALLSSLVGWVWLPLVNGISRRLETEADRFALRLTQSSRAFIGAMRRLTQQNLAEFKPPYWEEFFFYDHPSIAQRIKLAHEWAESL